MRRPGTGGENIEIVKRYSTDDKVEFEDEDFKNLVYIVEMKGVSALNPTEKLEMTNKDGVNWSFLSSEGGTKKGTAMLKIPIISPF